MNIYWIVVLIVLALGMVMTQVGIRRRTYVILMAGLHFFVCAFRYEYLVGDLIRYDTLYRNAQEYGYFDSELIQEWQNTGFNWLMKFLSDLTGGNFRVFLVVLALITCTITAVLIYRYSPRPWFSFLVWNCMTFFLTYDMCAIKQGLAMSILMLAMCEIMEDRPFRFLFFVCLAGFVHTPALIFLPAYFLAHRKLNGRVICGYLISAVVIYFFRSPIVDYISELYYEDTFELMSEGVGGRVIVIVLMLIAGLLLKGFREKDFSKLFNIMIVAAIIQMFASYDNVFTRLADYYLQFTILYIPMIFYSKPGVEVDNSASRARLPFNDRSISFLVIIVVCVLIWWYYTTCLGVTNLADVDNYISNFKFMWQ